MEIGVKADGELTISQVERPLFHSSTNQGSTSQRITTLTLILPRALRSARTRATRKTTWTEPINGMAGSIARMDKDSGTSPVHRPWATRRVSPSARHSGEEEGRGWEMCTGTSTAKTAQAAGWLGREP